MKQAFVSYARADEERVQQIVARLEDAGISCWFDQRDIPVSVPWLEEVRDAILRSAVFVGCESLSWYASQACLIEKAAADEFGKRIVHVDVVDQAPADSATKIHHVVLAQSDNDRAHTDLLVRSSVWDRRGRRPHDLAGGVALRAHRRVAKDQDRAFTGAARAFLDASVRRHRRRAWLSRLGGLVLAVTALVTFVFVDARRQAAENLAQVAARYTDTAMVHAQLERDPYDGLRAATAFAAGLKPSAYFGLLGLQDAVNTPLPDRSTELPGATIAGFATGTVSAEPMLYAADGKAGPSEADWPTAVSAVAASADGQVTVVTGPGGTTARVRSRPVSVPCPGVAAVSGSGAAVGFADGEDVCVWQPFDGTKQRWQVTGGVSALAVSPDGGRIAVVHSGYSRVEVRGSATGTVYRALPTTGVVRFSPDGRTLAVGQGTEVQLWDLATGVRKADLRGGTGVVRGLAWTADGKQLWAIAGDHRLTRWSWRRGERLYDDPRTWFVALSDVGHDGGFLAVTQAGTVLTADTHTHQTSTLRKTSAIRVITAAVDPAHTMVVLGSADVLTLADLPDGQETAVPVDDCTPSSITFVGVSPTAVVACSGGDVLAIDTKSAKITARVPVPDDGASTVAAARGGEVYVATGVGTVQRTDVSLRDLTPVYKAEVDHAYWQDIAISADGRTMALVGDGTGDVGHFLVGSRNADGGWAWNRLLLPVRPGQQSRAVTLNHDGSLGAIGLSDGTVEYWLPQAGNPGTVYTETPGTVRGMAFTEDGRQVVAVTRDGAADVLPGCGSCGNSQALITDANRVLADAVRMGLTKP
ncbi:TIR domain-containing protein [Amycolatopsis sp. DG1A-15b]|uniref:toll/interleukin-1 receptor domain-containing protein n=1 Tax=Amycolatopsis sp. DG1A-15b TaxID=3052846 RepID=UPI00255C1332|nr:TIR domain-containing protein [Amycolatopsis sp. DG1A-15b]WIX92472.1 TIR domain-containing protein [Amycolatopsis sp. DG1A-15b]